MVSQSFLLVLWMFTWVVQVNQFLLVLGLDTTVVLFFVSLEGFFFTWVVLVNQFLLNLGFDTSIVLVI